jgi:hypothetical protein
MCEFHGWGGERWEGLLQLHINTILHTIVTRILAVCLFCNSTHVAKIQILMCVDILKIHVPTFPKKVLGVYLAIERKKDGRMQDT